MDQFLGIMAFVAGATVVGVIVIGIIVIGVFVVVQAFTLILITCRLAKFPFGAQSFEEVARADAGEDLAILDAGRAVLEQQGFRYLFTRKARRSIVSPNVPLVYSDVYDHTVHDVRAEVCPAVMPTPHWPFDVYLRNTFTDGSALLTVNGLGHVLLIYPDTMTIADAYAPDFARQLAHHLQQRAAHGGVRIDPADAPALSEAARKAMLPDMVRTGRAYIRDELEGEPVYGLRPFAAIKAALRMRAGVKKRLGIDKPDQVAKLGPEAPAEAVFAAEKHAFVNALASLNALQAPRWFRWSTFMLSAGAFMALVTWWYGVAAALAIGAVVAIHEGGHWLAMRLAGFRDGQVFFVPGVGAATSGEKHDAHPLTQLAVYLAGPMPGLLLALGAVAWIMLGQVDGEEWWYATLITAVTASIVINMLNLLPLMPLDGGRVADLFVMRRLPWFRFVFVLASGGILAWAGFTTGDMVLSGLGALAFISVPHQYRLAKVTRDLLRQTAKTPMPSKDFVAAADWLFAFLSQPKYQKWSFTTKAGVGNASLPRFMARLPGPNATLLGLFVYLACIVVPIAILLAFALSNPARFRTMSQFEVPRATPAGRTATVTPELSWRGRSDARLAAAKGTADRIKVLAKLVDEADESEYYDDELRFAKLLYAETHSQAAPSRQHADAALKLAVALYSQEGKQSGLEGARVLEEAEGVLRMRLSRQDDSEDAFLLARVLDVGESRGKAKSAVAVRTEIVALHARHRQQSREQLSRKRVELARELDEGQRKAEAEDQLLLAAGDLKRVPDPGQYAVDSLALDHGWFLMSSGRPRDAVKRVETYLRPADGAIPAYYSHDREVRLLAAVAARSQGEWQEVRALTSPIQTFVVPTNGNLTRLVRGKAAPTWRFDFRAGLLLAEAQRKLGQGAVADELAAKMLAQYGAKRGGPPTCSLARGWDDWRKDLYAAIGENEKREFKCEDPMPR